MTTETTAPIFFDDHASIRRWIDLVGGIEDTARALKIDHRTAQRYYSGKMSMRLHIARELASIVGETIA